MVAATLAGGAFAVHSATSAGKPPQAPRCGLSLEKPADWAPATDPDGCWERRGDRDHFRTAWGGRYYYHAAPPSTSRYHSTGSVGG
jgi:hypothetical protein